MQPCKAALRHPLTGCAEGLDVILYPLGSGHLVDETVGADCYGLYLSLEMKKRDSSQAALVP